MRCLILSSCLLLLASCSSIFKNLKPVPGDVTHILKFKPSYTVALYKTEVNVTGHYLSGLLLIKKMPDSSTRLLFSNEIGFKFFDFEFAKNGDFIVHYIIKQMDRKAVIKTLRKDFELVLMEPLDPSSAFIKEDELQQRYFIFPQKKGYNYYITDSLENTLIKMQRSSNYKAVVSAIANDYNQGLPDTIGITHHNFNFSIGLKKIER